MVEFAFFFPEAHTLCVCFGEQGCVVPVRLNIHKVKANKQQQHKPQTKQNRDVTKEQTSCAAFQTWFNRKHKATTRVEVTSL